MPDNDNLIGKQLDNYRIVTHLGRGGMADVYLAEDEALQRKAVIKTMLPQLAQDLTLVARFQREAQATARLEHPNIVPVYTTGTTPDNRPYIAFQYVEGGSLEEFLANQAKQGKSISTTYALAIGQQMAQALSAAHAAGIVHRDLKPSNILLRRDGTPVLADLGIAAIADTTQRLTQTGNIIGTPYYMSPEQAGGKPLDGRSDIYSLGVILYELLSRQLPFAASSPISMLHAHIYEPPVPLEQVRPGLAPQTYAVVARCLQKDPNARFVDAQELANGVAVALSAEGGSANIQSGTWDHTVDHSIGEGATVVEKPIPTSPSRRWRGIVGAVLGVLVLIAALLAGLVVSQGMGSEPEPTVAGVATTSAEIIIVEVTAPPADTATPEPTPQPTQLPDPSPEPITVMPSSTNSPTATEPEGILAFSCGNNVETLYTVDLSVGRELVRLPNQNPDSIVPSFSHSGEEIVYRSNELGSWQIFSSNTDGSNRRQVTSNLSTNHFEPIFSPDDSQFAYMSDESGRRQIYIMNRDGTQQRRLTFLDAATDDPTWSIDNRIAFESDLDGQHAVYIVNAAGGEPEFFIRRGDSSATPAWSWDGQAIAFESRSGSTRHIWIADAQGLNQRPVTSQGSINQRPAWSPDGNYLAFNSNYLNTGDDLDIWIVNLETGELEQITNSGDCYDPAWGRSSEPTPTMAALPVGACELTMGQEVSAEANTRLWSQPDVTTGERLIQVPTGTTMTIIGGPEYGPVVLATGERAFWWQVSADGTEGWVWQGRIPNCPE